MDSEEIYWLVFHSVMFSDAVDHPVIRSLFTEILKQNLKILDEYWDTEVSLDILPKSLKKYLYSALKEGFATSLFAENFFGPHHRKINFDDYDEIKEIDLESTLNRVRKAALDTMVLGDKFTYSSALEQFEETMRSILNDSNCEGFANGEDESDNFCAMSTVLFLSGYHLREELYPFKDLIFKSITSD